MSWKFDMFLDRFLFASVLLLTIIRQTSCMTAGLVVRSYYVLKFMMNEFIYTEWRAFTSFHRYVHRLVCFKSMSSVLNMIYTLIGRSVDDTKSKSYRDFGFLLINACFKPDNFVNGLIVLQWLYFDEMSLSWWKGEETWKRQYNSSGCFVIHHNTNLNLYIFFFFLGMSSSTRNLIKILWSTRK